MISDLSRRFGHQGRRLAAERSYEGPPSIESLQREVRELRERLTVLERQTRPTIVRNTRLGGRS